MVLVNTEMLDIPGEGPIPEKGKDIEMLDVTTARMTSEE